MNDIPITAVPIRYPEELPVSQRRGDIAAAIRDNQVVIIAGETGSGKTTQLPKILLELGKTSIGHTQPRRLLIVFGSGRRSTFGREKSAAGRQSPVGQEVEAACDGEIEVRREVVDPQEFRESL